MKLHPFPLAKLAVAAVLMTSAAAQAVPLMFTVSGDYTANWIMDSTTMPGVASNGDYIVYVDRVGTFENATTNLADIYFFSSAAGGGMEIHDFADGDTVLLSTTTVNSIYSGSQSSPTFTLGSTPMTEYGGNGRYTLTVSAVPEPATVASMLAGLGLVGALIRRRKSAQA